MACILDIYLRVYDTFRSFGWENGHIRGVTDGLIAFNTLSFIYYIHYSHEMLPFPMLDRFLYFTTYILATCPAYQSHTLSICRYLYALVPIHY